MSSIPGGGSATRALAVAALMLGTLAMIAGDPTGARTGRVDVAELARIVERGDDRIGAIELARMIRDRTPGLRVIDLRPAGEFDEYRIPGAERMSLTDIATQRFDPDETIVLYSDGPDAAEGWMLLRARGQERVHFLRGGLFAWVDEVIEARIAADAGERERTAFREIAELSRYFGGQPTISDRPRSVLDGIPIPASGDSPGSAKPGKDAARRVDRRGC